MKSSGHDTPPAAPRLARSLAIHAGLLACVALLHATPMGYPLRALATFMHELGHLMAAGMTGGEVYEIQVEASLGGHVSRSGGWNWLIHPAGYLGLALYSFSMLAALGSRVATRWAVGLMAALLGVYAGAAAGSFGLLFLACVGTATLAAALVRDNAIAQSLLVAMLAYSAAIHSVQDLVGILRHSSRLRGNSIWLPESGPPDPDSFYTDATLMAWRYGQSEGFWSAAWLAMALVLLTWGLFLAARGWALREASLSAPVTIHDGLLHYRKGEGRPHTVR